KNLHASHFGLMNSMNHIWVLPDFRSRCHDPSHKLWSCASRSMVAISNNYCKISYPQQCISDPRFIVLKYFFRCLLNRIGSHAPLHWILEFRLRNAGNMIRISLLILNAFFHDNTRLINNKYTKTHSIIGNLLFYII
ncbi:hypothetical protein L9F63_019727, partial [Diploptera punctata]